MRATGRLGKRHFNVDKQRTLIASHGATCLVIPTVVCPCILPERLFDPLCSQCQGNGRFPQPHLQYTVTLGMIQDTGKDDYHEPGAWVEGQILCLTPPEVSLALWDLVTMLDVRDTFADEVLQRDVMDRLRFSQGIEMELVLDRTRTYAPGVDYVLTPPNTITWLPGGNAPASRAFFSVRYNAFPTYAVFLDNERLRVENHTRQSQEVILRRLDRIKPDHPFSLAP